MAKELDADERGVNWDCGGVSNIRRLSLLNKVIRFMFVLHALYYTWEEEVLLECVTQLLSLEMNH